MPGRAFLVVLFVFFAGCVSASEDAGIDQTFAKRHTLHSVILNEDIDYRVALPTAYEEGNRSQTFPVIYVFDGGYYQTLTVYSAASNYWGLGTLMPQAIVVGILSNNRRRDYTPVRTDHDYTGTPRPDFAETGGAEAYRTFLAREFIPMIEKSYRGNGHRVAIGHSHGALFALTDMISAEPLFQSYVVLDPTLWFGDNELEKRAQALAVGSIAVPRQLYIAQATRGAAQVFDYSRFVAFALAKGVDRLEVKTVQFEADDHLSIFMPGVAAGLRFVFDGYLPLQEQNMRLSKTAFEVYEAIAREPALLEAHFKAYSRRYDVDYVPEEQFMRFGGMNAERLGLIEQAQTLYEMDTRYYPLYARTWRQLGAFHEKHNNGAGALAAYRQALVLDPDAKDIQQKLVALEATPSP